MRAGRRRYRPTVMPDRNAWEPWPPTVIAGRLAGVDVPWCVAAGWALDLFPGEQTRPHGDIEITVPANSFPAVAARFADCGFAVAHRGELLPVTENSLRLGHQTWAYERSAGRWRLDVFREPHDGDVWIYRRDNRIRRPYRSLVERTPDGIPYLAPEVALLFKAKDPRDKDEADFRGVLPLLGPERRRWLMEALPPDHPWHAA